MPCSHGVCILQFRQTSNISGVVVNVTWAYFNEYQHMLHHWHAQIRNWTVFQSCCEVHTDFLREQSVGWKLQSINYTNKLHYSACHSCNSLSGGQKVHCSRPLCVSCLTHIHTLVATAQRSSILRSVSFATHSLFCYHSNYIPLVVVLVLFLFFSMFFFPTIMFPSATRQTRSSF